MQDAKDKNNLEIAIKKLSQEGFNCVAIKLSPAEVINKQSRPRIWIVGSRDLSQADVETVIPQIVEHLKVLSPDLLFKIENFLVPESSPIIDEELRRLSEVRLNAPSTSGTEKGERWGALHYKLAKETQHQWNASVWTDPLVLARYPWIETLSDRERGVLELVEAAAPPNDAEENDEEIWDLSQTVKRGGVVASGLPCLKPTGKPWLKKRRRLLLPEERLAIQGIFAHEEIFSQFSSAFKSELAGNAFSGPVFLVIFLALCGALAGKEKRDGNLDSRGDDETK